MASTVNHQSRSRIYAVSWSLKLVCAVIDFVNQNIQAQLRLEATMQSKIRVYESGRSEQVKPFMHFQLLIQDGFCCMVALACVPVEKISVQMNQVS